jgi:hypothetical protein
MALELEGDGNWAVYTVSRETEREKGTGLD